MRLSMFLLLLMPIMVVPACGRGNDNTGLPVQLTDQVNVHARTQAARMANKLWKIKRITPPQRQQMTLVVITEDEQEQQILVVYLKGHLEGWKYLQVYSMQLKAIRFVYNEQGYNESDANLDISDFLAPVIGSNPLGSLSTLVVQPLSKQSFESGSFLNKIFSKLYNINLGGRGSTTLRRFCG